MGTLLQHADYQLFEETIAEELSFAPNNFGIPADEILLRSCRVSDDLCIGHLGMNTPPLSLSAGEKQRVAIGGLLMMDSPVLAWTNRPRALEMELKLRLENPDGTIPRPGPGVTAVIMATHDSEFSSICAGSDRNRLSGGVLLMIADNDRHNLNTIRGYADWGGHFDVFLLERVRSVSLGYIPGDTWIPLLIPDETLRYSV